LIEAMAVYEERMVDEMEIEQLREMKRQMAVRGNWKEVKRINKMIEFHSIN